MLKWGEFHTLQIHWRPSKTEGNNKKPVNRDLNLKVSGEPLQKYIPCVQSVTGKNHSDKAGPAPSQLLMRERERERLLIMLHRGKSWNSELNTFPLPCCWQSSSYKTLLHTNFCPAANALRSILKLKLGCLTNQEMHWHSNDLLESMTGH